MTRHIGVLLALTTALFWGTLPIAAKVAIPVMGPFFISAFRFAVAFGVLALVLGRTRPGALSILRDPPLLVIPVALALAGNYVIYLLALARTTATAAQVMAQMSSVFLVAWGVLYFKERLTRRRAAGAAAALVGVFVTTWNGAPMARVIGSQFFLGNMLVILAVFIWSFYGTGQKVLNRDHSSPQVLVMVYAACALALVGPALLEAPASVAAASLPAWLALGYLAVNTLGAYGAFAEALKHADASLVAIIITTTPVFTIVFVRLVNVFLPGLIPPEEITPFLLAGAALVILGVSLVASERSRPTPEEGVPA